MNKVAVIDYGMGNLHSVAKAVEFAAGGLERPVTVSVTGDAAAVAAAERVIFPGVGAIRDCMAEINRLDVGRIIAGAARSKPVLAVCVGMQALLRRSEENGGVECLGLINGEAKYFGDDLQDDDGARLKVPHTGWNKVEQRPHPLWRGIEDGARFYFVHGYYADHSPDLCAGTTRYGTTFDSAIAADNIFATQFHPEKSQTAGLTLLKNFLQWDGTV